MQEQISVERTFIPESYQSEKEQVKIRRYDLDWLRFFAVALLIPFHAALIFIMNPNAVMYIKDTINSNLLDRAAGFVHQFHMPLLFFISGASSFFALKRRNSLQYSGERFSRLLIPAFFGIAILVPPMTYITRISEGDNISFWEHYQNFWHFNPADFSGMQGSFTPAHLWFLIFLFIFSIAALPLFRFIRLERSAALVSKTADVLSNSPALFLMFIPLALAASTGIMGNQNPLYYFLVFLIGYILMTDERYQKAIDKSAPAALITGILLEVIRQVWHPYSAEWTFQNLLYEISGQLNRWVWVIAILGYGHKYLTMNSRALKYFTESAFPFYLLHLIIVTAVGFLIVQLEISIITKYILIVAFSFIGTFVGYEIVKRIPVLRYFCGIKSTLRK